MQFIADPQTLQSAAQALVERFGAQHVDFKDEIKLILEPDHLVEACRTLRDEYSFEHLAGITGVDYWPQSSPRFHIVYFMHSYSRNIRLELRVPVNGRQPILPSIEPLYPNANWYEREVWDMFGVRFDGNSDLRRILMPYEWEGHPLQKNYPLGYEEVRFTFNEEELDRKKPSPKD